MKENNYTHYDFTTRVDRTNIGAEKWELMYQQNPHVKSDVMPMTVADMEFLTAPEIREGLKQALDLYPNGYAKASDSYKQAIVDWNARRHHWTVQEEWLVDVINVVSGIHCALRVLTNPGDGVIITRPVYGPFGESIAMNHRQEVNVPLIEEDGYYHFDFEAFEQAAQNPKNKAFILCNPHNPVGRVWTPEELGRMADICVKNKVYVIADEIWRDIVMPGYTFTPLATVSQELAPYLITCASTSKTFNFAGFKIAHLVIADDALREKVKQEIHQSRSGSIGQFSYLAAELAYTKGEKWLEALLPVLDQNQRLVHEFFKEEIPQIKAPLIEGTYVQWLDFRALGLSDEALDDLLYQKAEFIVTPGQAFGEEGQGFRRINLALPTDVLKEALDRLQRSLS